MSTTVNEAVSALALKPGADEFDTLAPSPRALVRRRARSHAGLIIGTSILLLVVILAVFAPLLAPYDPYAQDLTRRLVDPVWGPKGTWQNVFGTDALGRDVLSRLMFGARISLLIGFTAAVIAGVIGATLGVLGGYFGGRVDAFIVYLINVKTGAAGYPDRAVGIIAVGRVDCGADHSARVPDLGSLRRRHPQHDTTDARAGVHHVVAGRRGVASAYHHARDFPQPAEPDHRHRQPRHGADHSHRSGAVVSRPGRPAADAVVGFDGFGRARGHVFSSPT